MLESLTQKPQSLQIYQDFLVSAKDQDVSEAGCMRMRNLLDRIQSIDTNSKKKTRLHTLKAKEQASESTNQEDCDKLLAGL